MADSAGPDGGAYVAQHRDARRRWSPTRSAAHGRRRPRPWELVYCSRSGSPATPWLEPDVNDRLRELADAGTTAVVVVPIGFVSDHMEVVYDLDTEAAATAAEARPRTSPALPPPAPTRASSRVVRDLLIERAAAERGERPRPSLRWSPRPDLGRCAGPAAAPTSAAPQPALCRAARRASRSPYDRRPRAAGASRRRPRARPAGWSSSRIAGAEVAATKSSPTDVVTAVDIASEELIRARLLGARPDDGFLGEEGDDIASSSGVVWIADPIDGTVNFLYGIPQFAVSIAAEVDGEVVAGVVHNPTSGETFTAARGDGACLDGEPIQVSDGHRPVPDAGRHRLPLPGRRPRPPGRRVRPAAAARPRRPPDGLGRPRPLLRRLRTARRLRRARPQAVGPRGRPARRRGRPAAGSRGIDGAPAGELHHHRWRPRQHLRRASTTAWWPAASPTGRCPTGQ